MIHVPGRLFSVAPYTVRQVPDLFARNERVVSLFDTSHGPMAVVLVGAMLVSSMETVWSGVVTPPRGRKVTEATGRAATFRLQKGEEMGRFNMGSTVILLLPPGAVLIDIRSATVMGESWRLRGECSSQLAAVQSLGH